MRSSENQPADRRLFRSRVIIAGLCSVFYFLIGAYPARCDEQDQPSPALGSEDGADPVAWRPAGPTKPNVFGRNQYVLEHSQNIPGITQASGLCEGPNKSLWIVSDKIESGGRLHEITRTTVTA